MKKYFLQWGVTLGAIAVLGLLPQGSSAQTAKTSPGSTSVIATVNVYNTKIVSQNGNTFEVSFDITNREGIQPDIHYGVSLLQKGTKESFVVDTKNYDEVLNLRAGESKSEVIQYTAPAYLKGDFTLTVNVFTGDSLPLGFGLAGAVTLDGTGTYVNIMNESCFLTVGGEKPEVKYTLGQGVDVDQKEQLMIQCKVKNGFENNLMLTPQFSNHYRTATGVVVASEETAAQSVTLNAGETKMISLIVPKATKPQAYDAVLRLVDANNNVVSNTLMMHYVLRGESAAIRNLRLDKDYYAVGDTAKISFNWVGSADLHMQTREKSGGTRSDHPSIRLTLANGSGVACAEGVDVTAPKSEAERLKPVEDNLNVTTVCQDPQVLLQVIGDQGTVLAEKKVSIQSANIPVQKEVVKEKDETMIGWIATGVVALIALIVLVSSSFKKRKVNGVFIFLMVAGGVLFVSHTVLADSFYGETCDAPEESGLEHCRIIEGSVTVNKSIYVPNETLTMTAYIQDAYCTNGAHGFGDVSSWNTPVERNYVLIASNIPWYTYVQRDSVAAPTAGSSYRVSFAVSNTWYDGPYITDVFYGVAGCGSANGVLALDKPSKDLCIGGTASDVTSSQDNLNWTWTCTNSEKGTMACAAPMAYCGNGRIDKLSSSDGGGRDGFLGGWVNGSSGEACDNGANNKDTCDVPGSTTRTCSTQCQYNPPCNEKFSVCENNCTDGKELLPKVSDGIIPMNLGGSPITAVACYRYDGGVACSGGTDVTQISTWAVTPWNGAVRVGGADVKTITANKVGKALMNVSYTPRYGLKLVSGYAFNVTDGRSLAICRGGCLSDSELPTSTSSPFTFDAINKTLENVKVCYRANTGSPCGEGTTDVTVDADPHVSPENIIGVTGNDSWTVKALKYSPTIVTLSASYSPPGGAAVSSPKYPFAVQCAYNFDCSGVDMSAVCRGDYKDVSYTDHCTGVVGKARCQGTRTCDYNWKEVTP